MEKINLKTNAPLPKGNVTEAKIYSGPFPVIKPTKELSKEEIKAKIKNFK